jgi:hypothetical protein
MGFKLPLALIVLLGFIQQGADAENSPCRTHADTLASWLGQVKHFYGVADTAQLRSQGTPVTTPASIVAVTDSATCATAVSTYNQLAGDSLQSAYILALGSQGFVVIDPSYTRGEWTVLLFYDSQWHLKLQLAS